MLLGCLSQIATLVTAIGAGLGKLSFWWIRIPAFLAGSFEISNGPLFDRVIVANKEGRLWFFPAMLVVNVLPWIGIGAAAFWVSRALG